MKLAASGGCSRKDPQQSAQAPPKQENMDY